METSGPFNLVIGVLPHPERSPHWPAIEAFLKPAAVRGQCDALIGPDELVWAVLADGEPVAAATARLTVGNACEVVLVGGRDRHLWLGMLDKMIGKLARENGAFALRAFGRKGWARELTRQGWRVVGSRDGVTAFERGL